GTRPGVAMQCHPVPPLDGWVGSHPPASKEGRSEERGWVPELGGLPPGDQELDAPELQGDRAVAVVDRVAEDLAVEREPGAFLARLDPQIDRLGGSRLATAHRVASSEGPPERGHEMRVRGGVQA